MPGDIKIEMQSFCARVMNLCAEVEGANHLLDLDMLRSIATALRKEAEGVSKVWFK